MFLIALHCTTCATYKAEDKMRRFLQRCYIAITEQIIVIASYGNRTFVLERITEEEIFGLEFDKLTF